MTLPKSATLIVVVDCGNVNFPVDSVPVAAEPKLVLSRRYLVRLLAESGYLMWIDVGARWGRLIGHRRIVARLS